jgi:predicted TIM-barrel fold metal-dependent hydrolase
VALLHAIGIENVLWSTDFPHPICNWPNAGAKILKQFDGVPAEEVHAITWANGARMYGIS